MAGILVAPDGLLPQEERLLRQVPGGGMSVAELSEGCLKDWDANIYWGFGDNRSGHRAAQRRYGHKFKRLTPERAAELERLASGEEVISGGVATTYYVDYVNGSDANNGLGPDASDSTNKPWKTISKLLGAAGMASGDTAYLSPAGPFREVNTVAMTSAVAETKIIGDPGNIRGFKTSGAVAVAPGPVIITAYTTNDKTAPSSSAVLNLSARDYLTFQYITFMAGTGNVIQATTTTSTNITFQDCSFLTPANNSNNALVATTVFGTAFTWTIDRCAFLWGSSGTVMTYTLPTGSGSDYDVLVAITNCQFLSGTSKISIASSGASAQKGGGVRARNCTFIGNGAAMATTTANVATSIPCVANNSLIYWGGSGALNANTSGQITEDYNIIYASTPRTNVSAGAHSISDGSYAPLFEFGQSEQQGFQRRPFGSPMAGSPLLGFGNDGNQTAYDLYNRLRPAGGGSASPAVGALERNDTAVKDTSVYHTASPSWRFDGPGYQDFALDVDASATIVSGYVRYDGTLTGTKPQIQIVNGEECGVTAVTGSLGSGSSDADPGSGAWAKVVCPSFTPTAAGRVTVRIISGDTNGAGKAYFDDIAVA